MREFHINSNEAGQRFDKYLKKLLAGAPGSFVYKMLRKKNITLNGKKADGSEKLAPGDAVKLFLSDETFEKFAGNSRASAAYESLKTLGEAAMPLKYGSPKTAEGAGRNSDFGELQVVYEDKDILIINKPAGMLSQKAEPSDISANEYILSYLIGKGELTEEMLRTFKPSVCNRLDRNTSGLLIAGKTLKGLQEMSDALKERRVQKYYRCIVKGEVKEPAYINGCLSKDEKSNKVTIHQNVPEQCGAEAVRGKLPEKHEAGAMQRIETKYRPVFAGNGYSELEVHLITGRSHQIRAHLASIGHPVVGDVKYGDKAVNEKFRKEQKVRWQMLHAYRMVFEDGREVTAPCGEEFVRVRNYISSI